MVLLNVLFVQAKRFNWWENKHSLKYFA